ncbi:hypothetical protein IVB42_07600 [Bradyrhizobium sp. 45]|nr:hypothetical protein [Bradyrhizobium sp. 45]
MASKHAIALATPAVLASTRKLTLGELNLIWIANILVALVAAATVSTRILIVQALPAALALLALFLT